MRQKYSLRFLATFSVLIFFLIMITIAEGIARLLYDDLTPPEGRKVVGFLLDQETNAGELKVESHPYLFYINKRNLKDHGFSQHNSYGHRGREITPLPAPGTIRILAMGGSTTYGWGLDNPEQAWPQQLERLLNAQSGKKVEVINAGLPWGFSAEMLMHYMFRDRFLGAKIVILHEGGNDVAPALYDSYSPDYANFRHWNMGGFGRRKGERFLLKSYISRIAYAWWLRNINLSNFQAEPIGYAHISPTEALSAVKKNYPTGFERNTEALIRSILADKAIPIVFPFYLPEKEVFNHLSGNGKVLEPLFPALEIGWNKNVNILKNLSEKYKVDYFRMPPGSIPLNYFYDQCHLLEPGEAVKAKFLAEKLLPKLRDL